MARRAAEQARALVGRWPPRASPRNVTCCPPIALVNKGTSLASTRESQQLSRSRYDNRVPGNVSCRPENGPWSAETLDDGITRPAWNLRRSIETTNQRVERVGVRAMGKLPANVERNLGRVPGNLRLDIAQLGLDLFGIFDPTPVSDTASAFISLCRGDWFGAAVSVVSILPAGDVAKVLKLERYLGSLQALVRMAKKDAVLRLGIRDLMRTFKQLLDRLPGEQAIVRKLRGEVDNFLRLAFPPKHFPFPPLKHQGTEAVRRQLGQHGFQKAAGESVSYKIASSRGGAAGPKEIWTKFDQQSNGYFVVRMDPQGHAFKKDVGGNLTVVSQTRSGVHLSHGGRPHYHKEWVPADEYVDYLSRPTPNVVKYDDLGDIADSLKAVHIPR